MGCGASGCGATRCSRRRAACHRSLRLNDGDLIVSGVLQRADAVNKNGRVYPYHTLRREVERFARDKVAMCKSYGELNHPDPQRPTFRAVDASLVSHRVLEMHWRGNDLVGTVLILDTLPGLALRKLYTSGMLAGVSSRGLATLEQEDENGAAIIGNDYELIAFDYVSDPSTPDAFLEPIQTRWRAQAENPEGAFVLEDPRARSCDDAHTDDHEPVRVSCFPLPRSGRHAGSGVATRRKAVIHKCSPIITDVV